MFPTKSLAPMNTTYSWFDSALILYGALTSTSSSLQSQRDTICTIPRSLYANISGSDRSPFLTRRYADKETQEAILGIIPSGEVETIQIYRRKDRSVLADKQFVLKMMKLDPRDRPTARELLKDQWFTESSERTVGWFSKEEWEKMGYK